MASPIATLRILLGVDAREVEAGIDKAKGAAGGFGTAAKAGFMVAGAAATAGFAMMARGAIQMEGAQGKFQAATGRSREEAVRFSKDMNGLVGTAATVGRSYEEIAAAGVQVAQQFELTGEAGTRLTEDFLAFSKVTGQDAAGAVDSFDAALDAWGEPAERATGLMDQLIASNQKYGTDAGPAAVQVLQQMAPALQAMGMGLDDGVELLNAFEVAGLKGESAIAALNKGVKELEPGQTLDDLIAQIGAIEDPTLRAQEAIRIFGARAGVGLSNAIKPGMTSLDEFGISAGDAAGSADQAATDMLTTSDRIKMITEQIGGALRGLGQDLGPLASGVAGLVSMAATLGPKFAAPLIESVQGLAAKLIGPGTIAGTALGSVIGTAQAAAHQAAATGAAAISGMAARIGAMAIPLAPAGTTLGTAIGSSMVAGILAGLTGAGLALLIQDKLNGGGGFEGIPVFFRDQGHEYGEALTAGFGESVQAGWTAAYDAAADKVWSETKNLTLAHEAGMAGGQSYLQGMGLAAVDGAAGVAATVATGLVYQLQSTERAEDYRGAGAAAAGTVAQGAIDAWEAEHAGEEMTAEFVEEWEANQLAEFTAIGEQSVGAIASGALAQSMVLTDASAALKKLMEEGLTPDQLAMQAMGMSYIAQVRTGMTSDIIGAKGTAQRVAAEAINAIEDAAGGTPTSRGLWTIGLYYTDLIKSGLTHGEARALLAGANVGDAVIDGLETKYTGAVTVGEGLAGQVTTGISDMDWRANGGAVAGEWVTGFATRINRAEALLEQELRQSTAGYRGSSPPKTGPLQHIDRDAAAVASAWLEGYTGRMRAGARDLNAALVGVGGGIGQTPAGRAAPAVSAVPGGDSGAGADGRGGGITVNAYGYTTDDVVHQVERIQRRQALLWALE